MVRGVSGMQYVCRYDSPLGPMLLAAEGDWLTGAWFEGQKYFGRTLAAGRAEGDAPVLTLARRWLEVYFSGREPDFAVPLRPSGTMILYTVANGLYKFGEDQQFIPLDSLYLPNPNSLIIDRNNTYWIGTYNTGLVHYDPRAQRMERFDTSSGLVDNSLKAVVEDKDGNIWFSSSTHIGKYDVQEKTFSYLYDSYFSKEPASNFSAE